METTLKELQYLRVAAVLVDEVQSSDGHRRKLRDWKLRVERI